MTESEADEFLADAELVRAMEGTIVRIKEVRDRCLDAGVPAVLDRCREKGCATKMYLLLREEDLPRLAAVVESDWRTLVEQEGIDPDKLAEADDACPACGSDAPLAAGACGECGLQLE